jgi:hypothetical protein
MAKFDYAAPMADLQSADAARQNAAFQSLLTATKDQPVAWAYAVWDDLLQIMKKGDNRQRSIASQVLCSLAASDPQERMVKDVKALLAVTKDERFVTARHCLQALWKVGVAGERQRAALLKGLVARFKECVAEKNCTLIRYDILTSMRQVYDVAADPSWRNTAETLIALEADQKYRKKYAAVWRE